jgi:hypothetical protein
LNASGYRGRNLVGDIYVYFLEALRDEMLSDARCLYPKCVCIATSISLFRSYIYTHVIC